MTDSEDTYYPDVPPEFEAVQRTLDKFVEINYEAALSTALLYSGRIPVDVVHCKGRIMDVIRNNPPLASVPRYYRDGRPDYLWYSDFYDDITKDALRKYRTFTPLASPITSANYAEELAKIDLPYFRELVNLIGLEKLYARLEHAEPMPESAAPLDEPMPESPAQQEEPTQEDDDGEIEVITADSTPLEEILCKIEPTEQTEPIKPSEPEKPKHPKRPAAKRSYEPKMSDKQYSLLAECMETIRLFRRPVSIAKLRKLFTGRLPEPLQVTNQKSLVYLFDLLMKQGYIKETWISVAEGNGDFISFLRGKNKERYGSESKVIESQLFSNNRGRNKKEYIHGLDTIEDTVDSMVECGDK